MIDMIKRAIMGDEKYTQTLVDELIQTLLARADSILMFRFISEHIDVITDEELQECTQLLKCASNTYSQAKVLINEVKNSKVTTKESVEKLKTVHGLCRFLIFHLMEVDKKISIVKSRGGNIIVKPPHLNCTHNLQV